MTFEDDTDRRIEPLGQWGWLTQWPDEEAAAAWADAARAAGWPNVVEIVPAYRTVAVLCRTDLENEPNLILREAIRASVRLHASESFGLGKMSLIESEPVAVPVIYDGEDLAEVASSLGLTPSQVVALHTSTIYRVFAVGFLPGFPYAGFLPPGLSGLARRASPRTRVPAGSVAIAGRQTGIYPCESPGGWHILGRTTLTICDLDTGFFRFRPTDRVRFVPQPGGILPELPFECPSS